MILLINTFNGVFKEDIMLECAYTFLGKNYAADIININVQDEFELCNNSWQNYKYICLNATSITVDYIFIIIEKIKKVLQTTKFCLIGTFATLCAELILKKCVTVQNP